MRRAPRSSFALLCVFFHYSLGKVPGFTDKTARQIAGLSASAIYLSKAIYSAKTQINKSWFSRFASTFIERLFIQKISAP
jgi:hypothetical protein